jgi:hypothetical protein
MNVSPQMQGGKNLILPKEIRAKIVKARNLVGIGLSYRTGPPGYIGRRNSFLGLDSWAL